MERRTKTPEPLPAALLDLLDIVAEQAADDIEAAAAAEAADRPKRRVIIRRRVPPEILNKA